VWVSSLSLKTRQAFRAAAGSRHDPDVICVSETDLSGADGWGAQETRLASVSVLRSGFCRKNQKEEGQGSDKRETPGHKFGSSEIVGFSPMKGAGIIVKYFK
jgi:hypothetical protein